MIELNLLPDVKQEFIRAQRLKRVIISLMVLISAGAIGVVVLIGFYVYIAQPVRGRFVDGDIKKYSEQLKKNKNLTRDLTIQNQLATVTKLHQDKGVYDRLIDFLKTLNPVEPNNISITKARLDSTTGLLSIEASASNYQAIAVFNDTLKNASLSYTDNETNESKKVPLFSTVQITETSLGQDSAGAQVAAFKVALIYDPNAFSWNIRNPVVIVPSENTTPSATRVSVFADNPLKLEEAQ